MYDPAALERPAGGADREVGPVRAGSEAYKGMSEATIVVETLSRPAPRQPAARPGCAWECADVAA
jgi:hypothetical protein